MESKNESKVKAALARADSLTPKERRAIAKKAALARWNDDVPVAEYLGVLKIADLELPCAVLTDETRVLTETDFMSAMGMYRSGALSVRRGADESGARVPLFLAYKNLLPFATKHLGDVHLAPLKYRTLSGGIAHGIRADIISKVCEIWMDAKAAKVLGPRQLKIAEKAELLLRSLARVAIQALVDEATGYQAIRRKDELQKILAAYISPSLLPWTQRFPMDFYEEMFRLWNWKWDPIHYKRKGPQGPRYAGKLTRQLVYDHLPPGVLEELERKNPPNSKWQRKNKFFQHLSEDIGNIHVEKQVAVMTALLKGAPNKPAFWASYRRNFPDKAGQMEMDLGDDLSVGDFEEVD